MSGMLRQSVLLLAVASSVAFVRAAPEAMQGRWDITIATPEGPRPSWLEIRRSGHEALVGQFVGIVGSARPVSRIVVSGDSMRFAIPRQWEEGSGDLTVEGRLEGDRLAGRMTFPDGKQYDWTAVRAPSLRRQARPTWGARIQLLNARDLTGWRAIQGENQWTVSGGVLRNTKSGANLVTEQTFGDFRLHIEFRYPKGGNSGVYLRGRHEVQIEDNFGTEPTSHRFGGIYGFIEPSEMAARQAGDWQSFDITLVGRMVTVVANGRTVIFEREIPGITGGALDSDEGAPGPLMLQGDHGPIEYRNITITPAR
jgi:hypothetical protein